MNKLGELKKELRKLADKERAKLSLRYFKTGKGQYGEGDKFLGIIMPEQRKIAKKYYDKISLDGTVKLLRENKFHEERMVALLILDLKYKQADKVASSATHQIRKKIFNAYLANTKFVNNWDLVDVTCRDVIGAWLFASARQSFSEGGKNKSVLYKLAKSKNIWQKRIAIISTFYFISKGELDDTYKIAEMLLTDKHDLIHKAVGWALREAGKKDKTRLVKFLDKYGPKMPRTALRYAIEKFSPAERKQFLKKV